MFVNISYDSDFVSLMYHLKAKYGKAFAALEGIDEQLDINKFSKDFFKTSGVVADISVDSNSNISTKNNINYVNELPKGYFRLNSYFLTWKKLKSLYGVEQANRIIEDQFNGKIYINDFHGIGAPYCFNFSSYDIALNGLSMIDKIKCVTPKYLFSFKSQIEQFVLIASNSILGAVGLADLLIIFSYYIDRILETKSDAGFRFHSEEDCWRYIKENIVSMIYTWNQPFRSGLQSPFTNISVFDDVFLESLVGEYVFFDGKCPEIETVKKTQTLFLDIMNEEMRRTPVVFPVTTACFATNDNGEIIDKDFLDLISEKNLDYGFINLFCGKSSTLSSCCRLRSDTSNEYFNSFGAGSVKIGSAGVVTINLPRLALTSKSKEEFLESVVLTTEDVGRINNAKRHILKKRIENNNMPLYTLGFMDLNRQYSTCGLNGINEALEILGMDIIKDSDFVVEMINLINATNDKLQKQYKAPHNCEQTPSENSSLKLAKKDQLLYGTEYPFYSNQFLPLTTNADMLDRIELQGKFDKHFSGGSICHINIEEKIKNAEDMRDIILSCAEKGVIYSSINYNLQGCKNNHVTVGKRETCPICGEPIEDNYTRIVGYLANVKHWHKLRREEDYPNRQFYKTL